MKKAINIKTVEFIELNEPEEIAWIKRIRVKGETYHEWPWIWKKRVVEEDIYEDYISGHIGPAKDWEEEHLFVGKNGELWEETNILISLPNSSSPYRIYYKDREEAEKDYWQIIKKYGLEVIEQ